MIQPTEDGAAKEFYTSGLGYLVALDRKTFFRGKQSLHMLHAEEAGPRIAPSER
jgi:hypothetical protein